MEETGLKFRNNDTDFMVKEKMMNNFEIATTFLVKGSYKPAFEALKINFHFINPYSFDNKLNIKELMEALTNFFDNLESTREPKRMDDVKLRQDSVMKLKDAMDAFFSELASAYAKLGIWLKTVDIVNDVDVRLSEENFNDNFSSYNKKLEQLLKLDKNVLLSLFTINNIHEAWANMKLRGLRK